MVFKIETYQREISELCAAYGVRLLEVFGSAARDDFDARKSDVDFLVDFDDTHTTGLFDRYFGFKEALEQLFGRPVDLIEAKAIKNPYLKQAISQERVPVYGPGNQETDNPSSVTPDHNQIKIRR